jgi:hypothetical protein
MNNNEIFKCCDQFKKLKINNYYKCEYGKCKKIINCDKDIINCNICKKKLCYDCFLYCEYCREQYCNNCLNDNICLLCLDEKYEYFNGD